MGKKRKRPNIEVLSIHKMNFPKKNRKSLKRKVASFNNSSLIETLSQKKVKNLQITFKTSENINSLLQNNVLLNKNPPTSSIKNEKICDNLNETLFNHTIDLCQDENSFTNVASNNQPNDVPSKIENVPEIVDLSADTPDQKEVILLKDKSTCPKFDKVYDAPVIDISEDGDGENEIKSEIKKNDDVAITNDDILVVNFQTFKNNDAPAKFSQSFAQSLAPNSSIKSLQNISNCHSLNNYIEKNKVQLKMKLKKSKRKHKKKLKSTLETYKKLGDEDNWRHFKINNQHQENLAPKPSSSEVGNNIYLNSPVSLPSSGLRPIIIDGSNVAIGVVGKKSRDFSCKKLQICINYFKKRGHKVTAFVPQFRTKFNKSDNPALLNKLVQDGDVILTPSKMVGGKCIVPYDDRFIVQTAVLKGGIIVSRDNYRDLLAENPAWAETINYRTLPFTWVDDVLMFPDDPLGEHGPCLDEFLKFH